MGVNQQLFTATAAVSLGMVMLWAVLCLLKRKTGIFIGKFQAYLIAEGGRVPTNVMLKRKRHLFDPFCKSAHLKFIEAEGVDDPYFHSFDILFERNIGGEGWKIINYTDFADSGVYQIEGHPITEEHRTFSRNIHFSVRDKIGKRQILVIH